MVVALGAHSFAPIPPSPRGSGDGPASPGRPGQGAPSAADVWVPPWSAEQGAQFAQVKVEYVSPSAIETVDLCERKYGFQKLDRLDKGSMLAAELGTATHSQHERWFINGLPYDLTTREGELALATSDLLPDRMTPGLKVEQEMRFAWPSVPGGLLGGKIDLNWREPDRHIVLDHKTSSNVQQYGKLTRDALLHHPQAPTYAAFGLWFSAPTPAPLVELRWNYVNTKGKPKGTPSWHVLGPDEVHASVEQYVAPGARRILQIVDEANQARRAGKPFGGKDLPFPDPGKRACSAFGGCAFKSVCGMTPAKGIAIMADQNQDFLVRMGLAPAPLAPAAPAQVAPPPPVAQHVQHVPLPPPPVGYGAASLPNAHPAPSAAQTTMGYGPQINPPEGALPPPPPPVVEAAPAGKAPRKPRTPKGHTDAPEGDKSTATVDVTGLENLPSFLESAVLAVLPAVTAHMVPLVLAGSFQANAIGVLALEIAKAATAGVEQ